MPGPLPDPKRRRRNAPTIPTTSLPAAGRTGSIPKAPKTYTFGPAATAWWRWAWRTPQAAAWSTGDLYVVARRASLEDDLAALDAVEGLDFLEALDAVEAETGRELRTLIRRLAAMATGRVSLMREIREIDDRLGLTPKAMSQLRWTLVVPDETSASTPTDEVTRKREDRKLRLRTG